MTDFRALHRFSVIATVRNEVAGIAAFIESLLQQTLPPDEIVIVDGVSTDGTLEILERYEEQGKIRLISQPCNISQGRNVGIAAARNEYIAATDAGCAAAPDWLQKLAEGFQRTPAPDVVAGNYEFETHNDFEQASCYATDAPDRESSDSARYYPSSRSIAFRKSAWQAVNGYPEWLYAAEDTLFNIQLRRKGFRFHFAQDAKVSWRPRTTLKGLYKQYFNYARGNGRIGLGLAGYINALRIHGLVLFLLALSLLWPMLMILAAGISFRYINANFWQQARYAETATGRKSMLWRTLVLMEVVRVAGMHGFIRGRMDRHRNPAFVRSQEAWMGTDSVEPPPPFPHWTSIALTFSLPFQLGLTLYLWGLSSLGPALCFVLALVAKSIFNFSRTGPALRDEIQNHFFGYSVLALTRLGFWSLIITLIMTGYGQILLHASAPGTQFSSAVEWIASFLAIFVLSAYQFCVHLLFIPASLAASSNYRLSRFHRLWSALTPSRLKLVGSALLALFAIGCTATIVEAALNGQIEGGLLLACYTANTALLLLSGTWDKEIPLSPRKAGSGEQGESPMNLLMIGCDTLRADRLGIEGYTRALTPNLDALAAASMYLSKCFVPCARTAPSLASMLTGLFPQKHGIRDNFALTSEANFSSRPLAHVLADMGYHTVAISDWAGADLGKFDFGFRQRHLPDDQWNIKYLIRQGPKDIRLFLSLFTHNRFGKRYLPELHYLAGVPMSRELGQTTREAISQAASRQEPFYINTFFSSAHAPFGSEYPYYTLYSDPSYDGDSKFVMADLNDPFAIIERQRDGAQKVDLEQILALYDGGVRQFDDEVGRILTCLKQCGLADNTIVLIYSDHGIDFFEYESWGQGNSVVSDQSARVPIILSDPRRKRSSNVSTTTRTVDLYPTLLELLGVPVPANIDGVSLAEADANPDFKDLPVYGETGIWFTRIPSMPPGHVHYPDLPELLEVSDKTVGTLAIKPKFRNHLISAKDRMIRQGRWKLVRFPMEDGLKYSLYDTGEGYPKATLDVAREHPEVLNEMRNRYEALLSETPEAVA